MDFCKTLQVHRAWREEQSIIFVQIHFKFFLKGSSPLWDSKSLLINSLYSSLFSLDLVYICLEILLLKGEMVMQNVFFWLIKLNEFLSMSNGETVSLIK